MVAKTIALRIPAGALALELLQLCGFPIAAPSANRSGEVSATEVAHVCKAFSKERVGGKEGAEESSEESSEEPALILAGEEFCQLGIESTIVALLDGAPRLLRAGAIEARAIERVLGEDLLVGSLSSGVDSAGVLLAPGGMARHYAPARPLRLNARERLGEREALLGFGSVAEGADLSLSEAGDLQQAARNLYRHLHALDRAPFDSIAVAPIPKYGLGLAINDRLLRATSQG